MYAIRSYYVYGGHVISVCRALSYNGLANALTIAAINGGSHCNPTFAGDTLYAWSEVVEKWEIPGRSDPGLQLFGGFEGIGFEVGQRHTT